MLLHTQVTTHIGRYNLMSDEKQMSICLHLPRRVRRDLGWSQQAWSFAVPLDWEDPSGYSIEDALPIIDEYVKRLWIWTGRKDYEALRAYYQQPEVLRRERIAYLADKRRSLRRKMEQLTLELQSTVNEAWDLL